MKILYLSQYFPPEMGAPAARVHEFSRAWAELGHDVTVLTGFPNHPTGIIPPEYRGELVRREVVDGIKVVRAPIYAAANKGKVRRALNYFSFGASAASIGPLLVERPDVLVATSPQFLAAVAGYWLSKLKRVPWVFEVRDLWPRSIVEVGAMTADNPVIKGLEQAERFLYRHADHIVAVTHSFVDEIAAHGIDRSRISVVTNGVDTELFQPRPRDAARKQLGLGEEFLATYIGTHGMAHGLGTVLDAAALLRDKPVQFLLVGEGAEKANLKARAQKEGLRNVTFWDQIPRDQVAQVIAATDLCLVLLRDLPLFRTVIPSKIFEYLGAARPILTTVDGESRKILDASRAGIFSPPENAEALARNISELAAQPDRLTQMGKLGREFVVAHYSRTALAERYAQILAEVAQGRDVPAGVALGL
ncbi:MAG: glycosyltransferase family 4 protein [Deltaproteobacteria bacterium]|nr:glycosyltransferase family 4 protein [Deltaproteobacteria bacterium]